MKCPLISLTCLFPNSKMLIYNFLEIVFNTSIQQRNTHSKAPLTLAIIKPKSEEEKQQLTSPRTIPNAHSSSIDCDY